MMTVNELARQADVTVDTVRHYVRVGLLKPARNPHNGYKLFSDADVKRVHFIHQAGKLGYSLDEIKQIFFECRTESDLCPKVRQILMRKLAESRNNLQQMNTLQQKLEKAVAAWERRFPNGIPDGNAVRHLIESPL